MDKIGNMKVSKKKNQGEEPDADSRDSVKKAIREQKEAKKFPKPGSYDDRFKSER